MIAKESVDVRLVGTALIGGDFTGNARGTNALDIQPERSADTQVASGANSVAVGLRNQASDSKAVAFGFGNVASGEQSQAVGYGNTASGLYSCVFGRNNTASGDDAIAIGVGVTVAGYYAVAVGFTAYAAGASGSAFGSYASASGNNATALGTGAIASGADSISLGSGAKSRIANTSVIRGPILHVQDRGEGSTAAWYSYAGVEVTLMSKEVNLETVADHTITFPSGVKFWIDEIGILITSIVSLTTQPTIRFGITGTLAKHLAAILTTELTATGKREIHDPLVPEDGETTLTAGVTVAAVGTTVLGRFYWKGMFVEDE